MKKIYFLKYNEITKTIYLAYFANNILFLSQNEYIDDIYATVKCYAYFMNTNAYKLIHKKIIQSIILESDLNNEKYFKNKGIKRIMADEDMLIKATKIRMNTYKKFMNKINKQ